MTTDQQTQQEVESITVDTRPVEFGPKLEKEDIYDVVCKTVNTTPNKFAPDKTQLKFGFAVLVDGAEVKSEKGDDATLAYYTSLSRGPKLESLLTAVGVPFDKNGETVIKPADILGKPCRAFITLQPGEKDPTKTFAKIKSLVAK